MKTLAVLCLALIASFSCVAQSLDENTAAPKSYDPKQQKWEPSQETQATIFRSHTMPVVQSTGKTYNSDDLTLMARKDVNGVASTVAGVQSRPGTGETPSIRGAGASGTAYFVDGVRAYGALPVITR